jgi:predicted glycosyltransferase
MTRIWIDIINPSHALFFNSLIPELSSHQLDITIRDRAETVKLCKSFGINGRVIGTDYVDPLNKSAYMVYRTLKLVTSVPQFDISISFENGMCVFGSRIRGNPSILFCDNDLKFSQKKSFVQDLESDIKSLANYVFIPQVCKENFSTMFDETRLITYDGCKEDIYIADYIPDPNFLDKIPFDNYVVVRPEALASFYVKENQTIVPEILKRFEKENINVIYLPREKGDIKYAEGCKFYTPENPLNGLDLCYYADAVLTGSGTLAREAACMGNTSVSFFPSSKLLSVDQYFVDQGRVLHSRDVDEIIEYTLKATKKRNNLDLSNSKRVKMKVILSMQQILSSS